MSDAAQRTWEDRLLALPGGDAGDALVMAPDGETSLIATSNETAEVGNTVLVRGTLATDRDLGHGYHYEALIEEASIAVE